MQLGDKVKLRPPFDAPYPGVFTVIRLNDDGGCGVDIPGYQDGSDFDPIYLQKVEA